MANTSLPDMLFRVMQRRAELDHEIAKLRSFGQQDDWVQYRLAADAAVEFADAGLIHAEAMLMRLHTIVLDAANAAEKDDDA